jgi:hypothetical protein
MRFRGLATIAGLVICALIVGAVASPSRAASTRPDVSVSPPDGIYTCSWIAGHPAAALAAGVTCDPLTFFTQMAAPVTAPQPVTVTPDATGCHALPADGSRVGYGVYAWSAYEYSNWWQWNAQYGPANYEWYIQDTSGQNVLFHHEYDTAVHQRNTPGAANWRWGGHNVSRDTAENWWICYAVA